MIRKGEVICLQKKVKYFQGYVKVRLTGYAPERFLNLCSKRNILIWNLECQEGFYEFFISVRGFKELKPILRKTQTKLIILQRFGMPFVLHRYRKRKLFAGGMVLCVLMLYMMSLFIWDIEIRGNLHRTDSTILKFLEEKQIYHGKWKKQVNCEVIEELLRSEYEDVIWASAKIQGTRLVIDIQENLVTNQKKEDFVQQPPSDLVAEKDAKIHSIITRKGTPLVEAGSVVTEGSILVEGKVPIYNDNGEISKYEYCYADADILGTTSYSYGDAFSMTYKDKTFTGEKQTVYRLHILEKQISLYGRDKNFAYQDKITTEIPLKIGKDFYLPVRLYKEVAEEYFFEEKKYTELQAKNKAEHKLQEFCEKLEQKGVQIIENNVIIVIEDDVCISKGEITVIEPIGIRKGKTDESDRNNDKYTH